MEFKRFVRREIVAVQSTAYNNSIPTAQTSCARDSWLLTLRLLSISNTHFTELDFSDQPNAGVILERAFLLLLSTTREIAGY
jgi:hypothetical protein